MDTVVLKRTEPEAATETDQHILDEDSKAFVREVWNEPNFK